MYNAFQPFSYHGFYVLKRGRQILQQDNNGHILPFMLDLIPSAAVICLPPEDREEVLYGMLESIKTKNTFKLRLFSYEDFRISAVDVEPLVKISDDDDSRITVMVYPIYNDDMRHVITFNYTLDSGFSRNNLAVIFVIPYDDEENVKCVLCKLNEMNDIVVKMKAQFGGNCDVDVYLFEYSYDTYLANCSYKEPDTLYGAIDRIHFTCYNYQIASKLHGPEIDDDAYQAFIDSRTDVIIRMVMKLLYGNGFDAEDSPIHKDVIIMEYDWNDYEYIAEGKYIIDVTFCVTTPRIGRSFFKFIPSEADISKETYELIPTDMTKERVRYHDLLGALNYNRNGMRHSYYLPVGIQYKDEGYSSGGREMERFTFSEMRKYVVKGNDYFSARNEDYRLHTLISSPRYSIKWNIPFYKESKKLFSKLTDAPGVKYFFEMEPTENNTNTMVVTLKEIKNYFSKRNMVVIPLIDSVGYTMYNENRYYDLFDTYKQIPFVVSDDPTANQKHPSNSGLHSDMEELKCLWS